MSLMIGLLLLNALVLLFLCWRLLILRRLGGALQQQIETLRHTPYDEAPDLERLLGSGQRPMLVIDILNPMELAATQSWFADKFGALAPPVIRKIVYQQALKMTKIELGKHGVEAQLKVHRGA